jgi:hypothetical protein
MSNGLANLPVFGILAVAATLVSVDPDAYRNIVREDGILEWVTFWTFLVAAGVLGATVVATFAVSRRGTGPPSPNTPSRPEPDRHQWPWFLAGLGLFCLGVALEEISWGQRLLGYRPPAYFLAENFQQEFNFHNTIDDDLRQLGFLAVCLGYGVALPLSRMAPAMRRWLDLLGIVAPPPGLIPAFAATAILYRVYPWDHTGEWAEAMLGTAMLFAAVIHSHAAGKHGREGLASAEFDALSLDRRPSAAPGRRWITAWGATLLLGVGTAMLSGAMNPEDIKGINAARIELEALRHDFASARTRTRCGLHKRIYTMVEAYHQDHLFEGEFATLRDHGLPEDRARYFLDPWNSPYWVQHSCSDDRRRRAIFVYSMGPDRRRDSSAWEIVEDDLGVWISRPQPSRGD